MSVDTSQTTVLYRGLSTAATLILKPLPSPTDLLLTLDPNTIHRHTKAHFITAREQQTELLQPQNGRTNDIVQAGGAGRRRCRKDGLDNPGLLTNNIPLAQI